ncbi:MAG TPA: DUF6221 family protein [Pseudonocardiaceae bacterium]|jgi:hypothetical protein|nr:DUF6221 family protein [Pseudonocardiaceae bacterium]
MTDDLVAFIRARLDEDANVAQQAVDEQMKYPQDHDQPAHKRLLYPYPERLARCVHDGRHDPNRALRGVEAKRRILNLVAPEPGWAPWDSSGDALRALASEFADHPDCREEWKP